MERERKGGQERIGGKEREENQPQRAQQRPRCVGSEQGGPEQHAAAKLQHQTAQPRCSPGRGGSGHRTQSTSGVTRIQTPYALGSGDRDPRAIDLGPRNKRCMGRGIEVGDLGADARHRIRAATIWASGQTGTLYRQHTSARRPPALGPGMSSVCVWETSMRSTRPVRSGPLKSVDTGEANHDVALFLRWWKTRAAFCEA